MPVGQFVYTALPIGEGYNPTKSGYQIKACSDSLTSEQRDWLDGLCMHYGDTVYRAAPQEAFEKETDWRARADDPRIYPAEVLDAFPEVLAYTRMDENTYALTRVKYTGLTYDNRPGNFLAYSLVFEPEQLAGHMHHPLVAARSGILNDPPPGDDGNTSASHTLPDLPGLGKSQAQPDFTILAEEPYRSKLPQLISALLSASPQSRPLVLHILSWKDAPRLVEALLNTLPADMRRRTTFCTYESDRNWLPTVRGQRPAGMAAGHHLLALAGRDPRAISLRPDEIQSRFVVFNFVGDQFSPVAESAFASWAAGCVLDGRLDQLDTFYQFLENLGFTQKPDSWEALAPLFEMDKLDSAEERAQTIERFASLAVENHKAAQALAWLEERIVEWTGRRDLLSLQSSRPAASRLLGALPADDPQRQGYLLHLKTMAAAEVKKGQVQAGSLMLQLTGDQRKPYTLALLRQVLVEKSIPLPDLAVLAEQERWLELLLEGLAAGDEHPDQALPVPLMVTAIFQAAEKVNRTAETWKNLGQPVILPFLKGDWDREKQSLAAFLLKTLSPSENPEAVAELGLRMAEQPNQTQQEWRQNLQTVSQAAGHVSQPEVVLGKLVELVEQRSMPAEEKAVLLALLLEGAPAVRGREKLARAYERSLVDLKPNQRNAVRRELAKSQAWELLAQEFFNEALPLDDQERKKAVQQWRDVLFIPYPDFLDRVYSRMAARLKEKSEPVQDWQALAFELLPKAPQKPLKPGLQQLYEVLVMQMPLTPPQDGKPLPFQVPEGLSPQASRRGAILAFLASIQQQSRQEDWSLEKFPHDQPSWSQDVRAVAREERSEVLAWVLSTFQTSGVTRVDQARALVKLLHSIEMIDALGDALAGLLKGRDAVTWVLAGVAMVDYGLKFPRVEDGAKIARLALESFEKNQLHLLEEHLWKRFGNPDRKTQEKLAELCQSVGLAVPKALIEAKPQPEAPKKAEKHPEAGQTVSAPQQGVETAIKKSAGMFSKIGGLFQSSEAKKSKKENDQ